MSGMVYQGGERYQCIQCWKVLLIVWLGRWLKGQMMSLVRRLSSESGRKVTANG